jgi:hypothetical protein
VTPDQIVLLAVGALAVFCLVLTIALLRVRTAAVRTASELEEVRRRLHHLEQESPTPAAAASTEAPVEFVITDLGEQAPSAPEQTRPEGAMFADVVLRETVVKAASLAHGVRRGLAPATRNRIRFEMKQEVSRSRRQRRSDLKQAQHHRRARQRAALAADGEAS